MHNIYIYIYIHTAERSGKRKSGESGRIIVITVSNIVIISVSYFMLYVLIHTVSFHNFKSQKFKLSVSNPKSKYVDYLSVLSQISNCQGLGRKNKHEILKTDRIIISIDIMIISIVVISIIIIIIVSL